jgi:hypothetical protein
MEKESDENKEKKEDAENHKVKDRISEVKT